MTSQSLTDYECLCGANKGEVLSSKKVGREYFPCDERQGKLLQPAQKVSLAPLLLLGSSALLLCMK